MLRGSSLIQPVFFRTATKYGWNNFQILKETPKRLVYERYFSTSVPVDVKVSSVKRRRTKEEKNLNVLEGKQHVKEESLIKDLVDKNRAKSNGALSQILKNDLENIRNAVPELVSPFQLLFVKEKKTWSISFNPSEQKIIREYGVINDPEKTKKKISVPLNSNQAAVFVVKEVQSKLSQGFSSKMEIPSWILEYRKALKTVVNHVENDQREENVDIILKKGKRWWRVRVEGAESIRSWGIDGGKISESRRLYKEGKSKRTPNQQARLEAFADAKKKIEKEGFTEEGSTKVEEKEKKQGDNKDPSSSPSVSLPEVPLPMLAKIYDDSLESKYDIVHVQPKLDGLRCLADLQTGRLYSRARKPFETLQHISDVIRGTHDKNIRWVDGELYSHDLSIHSLNSIIRSGSSGPEERKRVQFHIFDAVLVGDFPTRWNKITEWYKMNLRTLKSAVVLTDTFQTPVKELKNIHEKLTAKGYEGLMVRLNSDSPYVEGKRSKALLKLKSFQREEFRCIDILEQKNAHETNGSVARSFLLEMSDGQRFSAAPKGSLEEKKDMWLRREEYKSGKYFGIIQFFDRTATNVPRFPVLIGFRSIDDV